MCRRRRATVLAAGALGAALAMGGCVAVAPPSPTDAPATSPRSPAPTATPAPSPAGLVLGDLGVVQRLFHDRFTSRASGWGYGVLEGGHLRYVEADGGALQYDALRTTSATWSSRSARGEWPVLSIEGTFETTNESAFGLMCRAESRYVVGIVWASGYWSLFAGAEDQDHTDLADGELDYGGIGLDAPAQLTLHCAGMATGSLRVRLYQDGELLGSHDSAQGIERFTDVGAWFEPDQVPCTIRLTEVIAYGGEGRPR